MECCGGPERRRPRGSTPASTSMPSVTATNLWPPSNDRSSRADTADYGMPAVRGDHTHRTRSRRRRGCGDRQGHGAIRRGEPDKSAADPTTRRAGCHSPRPAPFQQHAPASARRSQRSGSRQRSCRREAHWDRYEPRAPPCDIRRQRRQAAQGCRRRGGERLADREHNTARSFSERSERDKNLAAEARSEPGRAARAAPDRSTRGAGAHPARRRPAANARARCCQDGRQAASGRSCQYSRRAPAGTATAAIIMATSRRPARPLALAVTLAVLVNCQQPSQPGLEPLEQPSNLQAAEARVNSTIPVDRSRERAFVETATARVPVAPPQQPGATGGQAGDVTLNFVDTDIREIIRTILGTTLNVNYTIDPNVHGTGSIETGTPLPRSALLPTLETLLNQNGATLIERNGVYAVVPIAVGAATNQVGAAGAVGAGTQVVALRYAAARDL